MWVFFKNNLIVISYFLIFIVHFYEYKGLIKPTMLEISFCQN